MKRRVSPSKTRAARELANSEFHRANRKLGTRLGFRWIEIDRRKHHCCVIAG